MPVHMIKKNSCSKLKEIYFAISVHIYCRNSFGKTFEICHQTTRRHIPHEDYRQPVRTSHIHGEPASAQCYLFLVDRVPIGQMLYEHGNTVGWF